MPASTKDLTLGELMARFRCEDACRGYLEKLRWPEGPECPRCGSQDVKKVKGRPQYECGNAECRGKRARYQFSVTAGTKLQDSKLPLWKWFLAAFLIMHAKKGMSALQLKRMIGGSYETSWFLSHRIRAAMCASVPKLTGTVEVDETFVGGEAPSETRYKNKSVVMAAVQRETGQVRFGVIPNRQKRHVQKFVKTAVADEAEAIYTDDYRGYHGIGDRDTEHSSVRHSPFYEKKDGKLITKVEWVNGKVHTNTVEGVFSLLKRAIIGSYHKVGKHHLQAYLDEVAFKYNNRGNPYLFREVMTALMESEPLEYRKLTA